MKINWKKYGKSALISLGGAAIAFVTSFISGSDWGLYAPVVTAAGAWLCNVIQDQVSNYAAGGE